MASEEISKDCREMGTGIEILGRIFKFSVDLFLDAEVIRIMKRSSGYIHVP